MKKKYMWFVSFLFIVLVLISTSAAEEAYVELFPQASMSVGGSLDFQFGDFDRSQDQYAHVLREETDGTFTPIAEFKVWDAASGTGMCTIGTGMVTEAGNYWLTLGTDPDYTGFDEDAVVGISFTVLDRQIATPVIENVFHGSTVGTDVSASAVLPEGAAMIYFELGRVSEDGTFVVEYWDTSISGFKALGLCTIEPGTYQIRATALPQLFGEPVSETWADSSTAVYEFTLSDGEIPACPQPVLSVTETDYDPNGNYGILYTVPGAEAVTYAFNVYNPMTEEFECGTGTPISSTEGDTGTVNITGDDSPGRYHLTCWGRFDGVWSSEGTAVFAVNPEGYLDIPAVTWDGGEAAGELQTDVANPLVFYVSCEHAETLVCEIEMKMLDGLFEAIDWIENSSEETGNAVFDLSDLSLPEGTYQLRFMSFRKGWLCLGDKLIILTISDASGTSVVQ